MKLLNWFKSKTKDNGTMRVFIKELSQNTFRRESKFFKDHFPKGHNFHYRGVMCTVVDHLSLDLDNHPCRWELSPVGFKAVIEIVYVDNNNALKRYSMFYDEAYLIVGNRAQGDYLNNG